MQDPKTNLHEMLLSEVNNLPEFKRSLTNQSMASPTVTFVWNLFLRFQSKKTTSISLGLLSIPGWSFTVLKTSSKLSDLSQLAKHSRQGMLSHPKATRGSYQTSIVGLHVRRNSIRLCLAVLGDFSLSRDGLSSRGGVDGREILLLGFSTTLVVSIGVWLTEDVEGRAFKSTTFNSKGSSKSSGVESESSMVSWSSLSFANTPRLCCFPSWIGRNSHQKETGNYAKAGVFAFFRDNLKVRLRWDCVCLA